MDKEQEKAPLYIVTYPEALAELVVSKQRLDERILKLQVGQTVDVIQIEKQLREFGFNEVDYVYEPGQFALRGSILDVYSFSCELPFRIDFFGDEIDTIRTFTVQDQLSKDKKNVIEIVPELAALVSDKVSFLSFMPQNALLVAKDIAYIRDTIAGIYAEGFSSQALAERLEGATEVEQAQIMRDMRTESTLCTGTRFMSDAENLCIVPVNILYSQIIWRNTRSSPFCIST